MNVPYNLLPSTCSIATRAESTDATGAPKWAYGAATYSSIPCRLQADTSDLANEHYRVEGRKRYTLWIPTGDPSTTYSIPKDSRAIIGASVYRCLGPGVPLAGQSVLQRIELEELT